MVYYYPNPMLVIGLSATSGKTNYVVLLDTFRKNYFQEGYQ